MTNQQRRVCMMFTVSVCLIYLGYRGLFTLNLSSPFASIFSVTLYLAEIYGNFLMFLYFFQIWEPILPDPVPPLRDAKVDAYIPTYNEEPELLRGTIVAALEMDYPHETYVLDDGNRPEVRELCEELGAKYISRDSNIHAKAGNLNHAMEITDGDFIIVFDSDHVAERHFITRTLGYFADDDLAFIQTPHSYYNFDSFQGSLNYDKRFYWEEGQLFYNIVQPGKNYWNSASFCGSAAIFRKSALESVGLIATESITEDMQTGLRLHSNGWKSLYINERLVSGLAAPDLETFSVQRLRWGEGNLGTIFYDNPITMKGLSFAQRLNYLALMLSWTTGVQKLILYYTPLLMLLTGVGPVADMTWHLVLITIVYVFTVWYTVKASGNGYGRLIDTEITQMATFWTQCRGTWRALFNRKSANFVVTQKSGGSKETSIHDFLRPQYAFIGCSVVAITWAASRYFLGVSEDFLGLSICSILVFVHNIFAWIVIRRALAQRRFDWRHPCAAHIAYEVETADGIQRGEGITKDLCETGVGFLSYEKLQGHELTMTITAGDAMVTVRGKVCNWDSLVDYESRKEGKVQCYRYGVQFVGLGKEELRNLWHITTKYSVARRYVEFDPNNDLDVFEPVTTPKDERLSVPVRLFRPDVGDLHTVTETMTNTEFTLLLNDDLRDKTHLRAQLSAPTGEITGNARVIQSKAVDLGQMPLFAYRLKLDAFDGQSRGKLTTLMHLSHNPTLSAVTTLRPMKTRMPVALPATIVGTISGIAAVVTIMAALFFCHDQVLMARAALGKPLDDNGRKRLTRLVSDYERNPLLNERHFLRLREAMLAIKDEDAISRLNEALITNEFESPAARLQQAYTLEELGLTEKASEAFEALRENLDDFKSRRTRANVILAAARNAVKRHEFDTAERLYKEVWDEGTANSEIRVEYAGILSSRQKFELANEILTSEELTLDDLYLQASLFAGMQRFDRARRIYKTLALEFPDDIRARRGEAHIEAWTKNYELAISKYQQVLQQWPDDMESKIALTQTLAWNKNSRDAIQRGLQLIDVVEGTGRLKVWVAILESIAELDVITADDQVVVMNAFGERKNFSHDQYFLERLADCLIFSFDADQAAPLVEQLVEMCESSKLLRTRYAQTLYRMGDFIEAAKHYEHLIRNNALPSSLKDRGDILLAAAFNSAQRGATDEAIHRYNMAMTCYIELIEQDKSETTYWLPFLNAVAGSQEHTKEVSLAVLEIFNARASIAEDRQSMLRLSDALSKVNEDRLAVQVLDELAAKVDDVDTRWRRANVMQRLEKYDAADVIYEQLILDDVFAGQDEKQVQLLLAAANNAMQMERDVRSKGRYDSALAKLRAKLKKRPLQTPLWTPFLSALSGLQRSSAEDLALAMNIYRERERMAENFQFLDRLKDVLLVAKFHDKTLPLFEQLLHQKPHSRRLLLQYARSLHYAGKHAKSEKVFEQLLQKRRGKSEANEDVPDYEVTLAAANNAMAQGKRRQATFLYRKTIDELEPSIVRDISATQYWTPFLSALSGLNVVPAKQAEQVMEIYRNRDLYDEQADFQANLGHVMVLMDEARPAIDLLKQAILRFPENKKLRQELAAAYAAVGEHERANAYYRWVVERTQSTNDPLAESRLLMQAALNSQRLESKKDYEKYSARALEILTDQLHKNREALMLWQPFLDAAAGVAEVPPKSKEVVTILFKQWRRRAHDTEFLERLADVLVKGDDIRRAIILLEHQEDQAPRTRLRLAVLLKEVGEFESAENRFRELMARKYFVGDVGKHADLLLAAADNARKLGDEDLSRDRYLAVLQLLRRVETLADDTQLSIRYLDAVGGAPDLAQEDIANVNEIRRRRLTSKSTALRSRLVDVMLKLQRPQEALPILQTLVDEWPDAPEHQLRLAKTLQSLGKTEEAAALYERLIDSRTIASPSPLYVDLYASAARNSLACGEFDEAKARFEKLFEQPVDRDAFEVEYALSLEKTGAREHAIHLLESKESLSREHQFLLASMYASAKQYGQARLIYEAILQSQPDNTRALRGLADIAFWSQDYEQAVRVYRPLLADDPADATLHESLASSLLWGGDRLAALQEFTSLLQSDPRRSDLWIRFLEAAAAAHRLTSQQRRLVSMIEEQAGTLPREEASQLQERLADAYIAHRQFAHSIRILERLLLNTPNDVNLRAKLAMALIGVDRVGEALPMLEELVKTNPKTDSLRTQLAQAYIAAEKDERANEELTLLLARAENRWTLAHARLLLGGASVSQRLDRRDEASERFASALDVLQELLKENEKNRELWQPFLDAAAGTRNFSAEVGQLALRIFERREQHEPTKVFLTRVVDVMAILDRPRDVLPLLKRLNLQYPDDHEIEGRLANTYLSLRDFEQAIPLLTRLAKRNRPGWKWQLQLAAALHTSKEYRKAESLYEDLLVASDFPDDLKATLLLGAARNCVALKKFDLAQSRFEQRRLWVATADTVDDEYAGVLLELGEPQRVIDLLEDRDLTVSLKRVLAAAHETLGQRESARQLFAQILSAEPRDDAAMRGLARIALAEGEYELSLDLYNQLLQLHPLDQSLQYDRGLAVLSLRRFQEAAKIFRELIDSDLPGKMVQLAYLQSLAGLESMDQAQWDLVEGIHRQVLGTIDVDLKMVVTLADIMLRARRPSLVLQLTEPYVMDSRQSDEIAQRYAHALLSLGQPREAVEIYRAWLSNEPSNLEAKYLLATALQATGQRVLASGHFEELLEAEEARGIWYLSAADNAEQLGQTFRAQQWANTAALLLLRRFEENALPKTNQEDLLRALNKSKLNTEQAQSAVFKIHRLCTASKEPEREASPILLVNLARALQRYEALEELERLMGILASMDLSEDHLAEQYAQLLVDMDRCRESLPIYRQLQLANPENVLYPMQLARAHYRLEEYTEAAIYFDQVLENEEWRQPITQNQIAFVLSCADTSRRLGRIRVAQQRYELALDQLRPKLRRDFNNTKYWIEFLYAMVGALDRDTTPRDEDLHLVRKIFSKRHVALATHPEQKVDFVLALVASLHRCDELENAKQLLVELLQEDERLPQARLRLAQILESQHRFAEAARHYDQLLSQEKKDQATLEQAQTWISAAFVYSKVNRLHEASVLYRRSLHEFRQSLMVDASDHTRWLGYLSVLNTVNEYESADVALVQEIFSNVQAMDSEATSYPRFSPTEDFLSQLGESLAHIGRVDAAIEVFKSIGDVPRYYFRIGTLLAQSGRYPEALKYFQRVESQKLISEEDETFDDFLLSMGNAERRVGLVDSSVLRYQQVARKLRALVAKPEPARETWLRYLQALQGVETLSALDLELYRAAKGELDRFVSEPRVVESMCQLSLQVESSAEEAMSFIEQAHSLLPGAVGVQVAKSRGLFRAERLEEADRLLTELRSKIDIAASKYASGLETDNTLLDWLAPANRGEITLLHGRVKSRLEQHTIALELFEASPQLSDVDPLEYAAVLAKADRVKKAIEVLEQLPQKSSKVLTFLASLLIQQEEFAEARSIIEQVLSDDPQDADTRRLLANTLFWARQYDEAIEKYLELLEEFPGDRELRTSLGKSLLWVGRYDDASMALGQLVREDLSDTSLWAATLDAIAGSGRGALQDPSLVEIKRIYKEQPLEIQHAVVERLSTISRRDNEPMLARTYLLPYIETEQPPIALQVEYADVLSALKQSDEAREIYEKVLADREELTEGQALEYRLRYADVLHVAKEYEESQRQLDQLLEQLDNTSPARLRHALLSTARNLVALNRHQEALEYFDRLRELDPESFDLHEEYAGALLSASRPEEALEWILQAPTLSLDGEYLLGAIYSNVNAFPRAVQVYKDIVQRHPKQLKAWRLLADNASWAKDYRTGIHIYKQLLLRAPEDESLRVALADAWLWSEKHQLALEVYFDILQDTPDRYDLWARFVQAASGDVQITPEMQRMLRTIVDTRQDWPDEFPFRLSMVDALVRLGDEQGAISLLKELLQQRPNDRGLRRRLADELHRLERFEEAEGLYQSLLRDTELQREPNPARPHWRTRVIRREGPEAVQ